jgi:hypothetical protein
MNTTVLLIAIHAVLHKMMTPLPTVTLSTPNPAATSWFWQPSSQAGTIRARNVRSIEIETANLSLTREGDFK